MLERLSKFHAKRKRGRETEDETIEKVFFLFDMVFNKDLFKLFMGRCLSECCVKRCELIRDYDFQNEGKHILDICFFSRQPNEPMKEYNTDLGKQYSSLKRSIMLTAVRAVQRDRLGMFKRNDGSAGRDENPAPGLHHKSNAV